VSIQQFALLDQICLTGVGDLTVDNALCEGIDPTMLPATAPRS
jgi:hypothetical protein